MSRTSSPLIVVAMLAFFAGCTPPPSSATKPSPTTAPSLPAATQAAVTVPSAAASPAPTASPTPTVFARLGIPPGTPRCRTSQLEVGFVSPGAAAGNVEINFEMRNKSPNACWVYGFVGFQTLDGRGRPLPQELRWTTDSFFGKSNPSTRILLATGTPALGSEPSTGHAFFNIATNDVLCDTTQVPVVSLEIWPPDERLPLIVPAQSMDGRPFFFCRYLDLNPLQVKPNPSLG